MSEAISSDPVITPDHPLFPNWVPEAVKAYVNHVENGRSIRAVAREAGCHASTILRQIRRTEERREDVLVDHALARLEALALLRASRSNAKETPQMNALSNAGLAPIDDETLNSEAQRILRRLNEPGACLALAADMEKAVVVRDDSQGNTLKTAVVDAPIAEAFALKDWIKSDGRGRIIRYKITPAGRMALKRMLARDEARRRMEHESGAFQDQHRRMEVRETRDGKEQRRVRYSVAESPLILLSRRKDKSGAPFLSNDLVLAGERLREDFELAQMGPRVTQNWEKFLTAGVRGDFQQSAGGGNDAARDRVRAALADLGPGLGDVALRCCCFLEGMEAVEQRMGWSARSGKIVLRIALTRLQRHYDEVEGAWSPMIG